MPKQFPIFYPAGYQPIPFAAGYDEAGYYGEIFSHTFYDDTEFTQAIASLENAKNRLSSERLKSIISDYIGKLRDNYYQYIASDEGDTISAAIDATTELIRNPWHMEKATLDAFMECNRSASQFVAHQKDISRSINVFTGFSVAILLGFIVGTTCPAAIPLIALVTAGIYCVDTISYYAGDKRNCIEVAGDKLVKGLKIEQLIHQIDKLKYLTINPNSNTQETYLEELKSLLIKHDFIYGDPTYTAVVESSLAFLNDPDSTQKKATFIENNRKLQKELQCSINFTNSVRNIIISYTCLLVTGFYLITMPILAIPVIASCLFYMAHKQWQTTKACKHIEIEAKANALAAPLTVQGKPTTSQSLFKSTSPPKGKTSIELNVITQIIPT